ncbi:MAG: acylneuraminate cytidylyltransferase family protein [bacterium]
MSKNYAFIFARGGSKGIPRKNIKLFNGKPLIAYSILLAQNMSEIKKVFVSTDDDEIEKIAKQYSADVIKRPQDLATDTASEYDAWRHAILYLQECNDNFDRFISLPTTSPLRNKNDIQKTIECLDNTTDFVITITNTNHSPYFNMVQKINDNVKLMLDSEDTVVRRQDAPKAFNITTVAYAAHVQSILNKKSIFDGEVKYVEIPEERAIDIDTPLDFDIAAFLYNRRTNFNER